MGILSRQQETELNGDERKHQRKNYMSQGTIARSRKKQLEKENRKKINKNIDKYYDEGALDVELSRAMVAEKDLEMIHHKHFRKYEAEKRSTHSNIDLKGKKVPKLPN